MRLSLLFAVRVYLYLPSRWTQLTCRRGRCAHNFTVLARGALATVFHVDKPRDTAVRPLWALRALRWSGNVR